MILNQFNKTNSVENLVTTQILKLESLISRNDSLDLSLISTNFLSIAGSGKLRQPKLNKKELSLCNKTQIFSSLFPICLHHGGIKFSYSNLDFLRIYRIYSLKYQRSTTMGCKYIGIRKSEFVVKTQFLWLKVIQKVSALHILICKRFFFDR